MGFESPRIVQDSPWKSYRWLLFLPVLGLVYWLAASRGEQYREQADARMRQLEQQLQIHTEQVSELEEQRERLQNEVVLLQRAGQIDREAARQVQQELKASLAERAEVLQELTILKGIIDNGLESTGLYIQGFRLERAGAENEYRVRFTVSKSLKLSGAASGWIQISLQGELDGQTQTLDLLALTQEQNEKLKMQFRHFQDLEQVIRLPQGFTPHSVLVEVKPSNKKLSPVKQRFDWLVLG